MSEPREPSALERLRRLEEDDLARRKGRLVDEGAGTAGASKSDSRRRGVVGGTVAGLVLLLLKGKSLLVLLASKGLLLLSALSKLWVTLGTMGASVLFYSGFYGWKFAFGLVVLILVHELGHGVAAKLLGLKVGAPIFIPGFGAVIALKGQPRSTWASAIVGYGGPLAGTLGGLAVLCFGHLFFDAGLALALAHFTFLLNFFNLVPVGGLDGDHISEPFERVHWGTGLAFTGLIAALTATGEETRPGGTNPQMLFLVAILVLGIVKAIRVHRRVVAAASGDQGRLVDRLTGPRAGYTQEATVEPGQRRAAALAYFGLIGLLAWLAGYSEPPSRKETPNVRATSFLPPGSAFDRATGSASASEGRVQLGRDRLEFALGRRRQVAPSGD